MTLRLPRLPAFHYLLAAPGLAVLGYALYRLSEEKERKAQADALDRSILLLRRRQAEQMARKGSGDRTPAE